MYLIHFRLQQMIQHHAQRRVLSRELDDFGYGCSATRGAEDFEVHGHAQFVAHVPCSERCGRIEPGHAAIGFAHAEQTHTGERVLAREFTHQIRGGGIFGIGNNHCAEEFRVLIRGVENVAVIEAVDHALLHSHDAGDILFLHPVQHA